MKSFSPFYVMTLLERAKQLEAMGKVVIHMEVGEPDFPTPDAIVKAGLKQIQSGQLKYTPAAGLPELRDNIAAYYQSCYGVTIDRRRIFITPGASGALLLALGVTVNPAETVMSADPCYPCNANFIHFLGGKIKLVAVTPATQYQLNVDLIQRNWQADMRGVMIASPSNPTGTLIDKATLKASIQWVNQHGGCVYSDEIYHGLVYDKQAHTALEFSHDVFVINSFSKYFAMTGWRIGWLIVPEPFIDSVERLAQNIFIASATHSQYAALAAFSPDNLTILEQRKQLFAERRNFLLPRLQDIGFEISSVPEGAFYIYANCAKLTENSFQFAQNLLEQTGVAITPGKDFGHNNADQYVRFSYTVSIDKMAIALKRIRQFLVKSCR